MARSRQKSLDPTRLLEAAQRPFCLLDAEARIARVNVAFAAWCGCTAEELQGLACGASAPSDATRAQLIAAALCPPAPTEKERIATARVDLPAAEGVLRSRRATFVPLSIAGGDDTALIVLFDNEELPSGSDKAPAAEQDWPAALARFRARNAGRYRLDLAAGSSAAARRLRAQVELASQGRANVVVIGPTGSGRRQTAKAIHLGVAPDRAGPLMTVESTLATAESVAAALATVARQQDSVGGQGPPAMLVADADRLPSDAQAELWRALRGGDRAPRVLATAARSLLQLAHDGRFRSDLAHRLTTFEIVLPPLAERREDIPLLAQALLAEQAGASGRETVAFSPEALERLAAHRWPGNIAELALVVREAHQQCEGDTITSRDLPDRVRLGEAARRRDVEPIDLDAFIQDVEKELIDRALQMAKGNKAAAARLLGLTRPRLYRRMEQFGLATGDADEGEST